jgi:hypothetical protein
MTEDPHPLKEAAIDLGTWLDTWRDQPDLESLVDAVRESWMDYVAGSGMFVIPRAADGRVETQAERTSDHSLGPRLAVRK